MSRRGILKRKTESWRRILFAGFSLVVTATAVAQIDERFVDPIVPAMPPVLDRIESSDPKDGQGAIKLPSVYFIEPKDGATVSREVRLKFGIEGGLKVEKAGEVVPGEGHFHVLVDTKSVPRGKLIPSDAKHIHFPNGATEATIKLEPGQHTLTLLFGTGTHVSYGEMMSRTIRVRVK